MNKHIELVEKYLANKDSVSQEELQDNSANAAYAANNANNAANNAAYAAAAYAASDAAYDAAYAAAYAAANKANNAAYYATRATHWVAEYHKEVKEQGQ